jgi:D-serine dehydratase
MLTSSSRLSSTELQRLVSAELDDTVKGVPLGVVTSLDRVAEHGWNVAAGDLPLPVTTLYADAVESNVQTMARYCERVGASLAPHGKTTMSPQLFDRQLAAGAWGLTCATPTQAAVMRRFGAQRILMANPLVEPNGWRWVVAEVRRDPEFEFLSLVDSVEGVRRVDELLRAYSPTSPLPVLLEVGVDRGRSGVRTIEDGVAVAEAVAASEHLRLVGVEAYEGLVATDATERDFDNLNAFFTRMRRTLMRVAGAGLLQTDEVIVTAGGSDFFDQVVAHLSAWEGLDQPVRLVLRSGCYISHDSGKYHRLSPLDGRALDSEPLRLENALTAWTAVLSTPEPGLAILGAGKRDLAHDLSLPAPRTLHRSDGSTVDLRGRAEVFRLMDQHASLRFDPSVEIATGDIVALDSDHPCTAFDKSPFIPLIDRDNNVVDAIRTFF